MRVEERGPAGIAKTYPTRKLPRGPRLIDDSIQFGSLDPAPPVPLGGRRDLAAGPELCEPVTHENHGQSACGTRLERIDFREPSRADAADGLGEECQADIRDSRIQCVEDVLGRRITSQWRRTRWNRGVRNLFHNWTPGRGVERVRAQADKRLNEWRKGSEGCRTRAVTGQQKGPLVDECAAAERHDPNRKPDVVRDANNQKNAPAEIGSGRGSLLDWLSRLELPVNSGGVLGPPKATTFRGVVPVCRPRTCSQEFDPSWMPPPAGTGARPTSSIARVTRTT